MAELIYVRTIAKRHVEQLPVIHRYKGFQRSDAEYDWTAVKILGRLQTGEILTRHKKSKCLERVSIGTYVDNKALEYVKDKEWSAAFRQAYDEGNGTNGNSLIPDLFLD